MVDLYSAESSHKKCASYISTWISEYNFFVRFIKENATAAPKMMAIRGFVPNDWPQDFRCSWVLNKLRLTVCTWQGASTSSQADRYRVRNLEKSYAMFDTWDLKPRTRKQSLSERLFSCHLVYSFICQYNGFTSIFIPTPWKKLKLKIYSKVRKALIRVLLWSEEVLDIK